MIPFHNVLFYAAMTKNQKNITALALYSGGLDSTLACRLVMAQSIRVIAVKFISPFFGYDLPARAEDHIREVEETYGISLKLVDVSPEYLRLLRAPAHGYGKNFNPCVDCKIFMLKRARAMMAEMGASFLITGEVVGQRPMSQRRDTLRVIERDSGCADLLVRPLCARNLSPTKPELAGLIDRERLLNFSGRSRTPQMQLAEEFGITDYPSPAGGCILTDPILSKRIEKYYRDNDTEKVADILLLMVGRQFRLPGGGWLALGRNHQDNLKITALRQPDDYILEPLDIPGPTALLRHSSTPEEIDLAAGLVIRYARKSAVDKAGNKVLIMDKNGESVRQVPPLADDVFRGWLG